VPRLLKPFVQPGPLARDCFMGLGGLLLVLAVIAMAGSTFTFDLATKAQLKPVAAVLAAAGALCWLRGHVVPAAERRAGRPDDPS